MIAACRHSLGHDLIDHNGLSFSNAASDFMRRCQLPRRYGSGWLRLSQHAAGVPFSALLSITLAAPALRHFSPWSFCAAASGVTVQFCFCFRGRVYFMASASDLAGELSLRPHPELASPGARSRLQPQVAIFTPWLSSQFPRPCPHSAVLSRADLPSLGVFFAAIGHRAALPLSL